MKQSWWAEGELFEGCNCNLLCPCHITFRQSPSNGYCDAIWGVAFQEGRFGEVDLAGLGAVIFVHSPGPTMADADWTSVLYVDEAATNEQSAALWAIFSGIAGGAVGDYEPVLPRREIGGGAESAARNHH